MLAKKLRWFHLWGIGVGIVIGAAYFGWNYGLQQANLFTFMLATAIAGIFYLCSILCNLKLVLHYPKCGGQFEYAHQLTPQWFSSAVCVAGIIVFAVGSASLAAACGAFFHSLNPELNSKLIAVVTILAFAILNLTRVTISAAIQLIITIIALLLVIGFILLVIPYANFTLLISQLPAATAPHFRLTPLLFAIPFGIWLFSGVEFIAMGSEETTVAKNEIPIAYISAIVSLLIINILVVLFSAAALPLKQLAISDTPLISVLQYHYRHLPWLINLFVLLSLSSILCSLNGDVYAGSRCIVSAARHGYLPQFLATSNRRNQAPVNAVALVTIMQLIGVLFLNLDQLVYVTVFCVIFLQFSNLLCIIKVAISKDNRDLHQAIVPPLWLLILTLLLFGIIFISLLTQQTRMFWYTLLIILVGSIIISGYRKRRRLGKLLD